MASTNNRLPHNGLIFFSAIALLLLALPSNHSFPVATWTYEGICREVVSGSTEGRQALVGSFWHAPLPTLFGLPGAALLPHSQHLPLAALLTALISLVILSHTLFSFCRRHFPPAINLVVWAILLVPISQMRHILIQPHLALSLSLGLASLLALANWHKGQTLGDLVKFATCLALLALCGAPLAGFTLLLALALPLSTLLNPALRPRFQGVLILGLLPTLYALGVWLLMSRVILMDALYPWRGISATGLALAARGVEYGTFYPSAAPIFIITAILFLVAAVRRQTISISLSITVLLTILWLYLSIHSGYIAGVLVSEAFTATALLCLISASIMEGRVTPRPKADDVEVVPPTLAMGRVTPRPKADDVEVVPPTLAMERVTPRLKTFPTILYLAALLALSIATAFHLKYHRSYQVSPSSSPTHQTGRQTLEDIQSHVESITPYGRVFICGYRGLSLLSGGRHGIFEPCLDLRLDVLRREYERQDLFLLIPKPTQENAFEPAVWRYDDIYAHGTQRALFADDFGDWRLFQIISAPTADQLEEWRTPLIDAQ